MPFIIIIIITITTTITTTTTTAITTTYNTIIEIWFKSRENNRNQIQIWSYWAADMEYPESYENNFD